MNLKTSAIILSLVISVSLISVSCTSSSSSSSVDSDSLAAAATVGDSSGLSSAAKLIAQGILDADGDKVFAQISKDCQSKLTRTEVSKQLKTVRAYITTFVGASLEDFKVTKVETRRVKKDETGQARYTIEVKGDSKDALTKALEENNRTKTDDEDKINFAFDEPTEWFDFVYESSTWKLESCQEFLRSAGVLTNSTTTSSTTTSSATPAS